MVRAVAFDSLRFAKQGSYSGIVEDVIFNYETGFLRFFRIYSYSLRCSELLWNYCDDRIAYVLFCYDFVECRAESLNCFRGFPSGNGSKANKLISLTLKIDTLICPVMEYFEIFLERMVLCKKSAEFFGCEFELIINDTRLL